MRVLETDEGWSITSDERMIVTRCCIDRRFTMLIEASQTAEVTLECAFEFTDGAAREVRQCDPAQPDTLTATMLLVHRSCQDLEVKRGGELTLTFDDGSRINSLPHNDYEAWSLVLDDGARLVCRPGGGVAAWRPQAEPR